MLWEYEPQASVSTAFYVLPNVLDCLYHSIETRIKCFLSLLENTAKILFARTIVTSTAHGVLVLRFYRVVEELLLARVFLRLFSLAHKHKNEYMYKQVRFSTPTHSRQLMCALGMRIHVYTIPPRLLNSMAESGGSFVIF